VTHRRPPNAGRRRAEQLAELRGRLARLEHELGVVSVEVDRQTALADQALEARDVARWDEGTARRQAGATAVRYRAARDAALSRALPVVEVLARVRDALEPEDPATPYTSTRGRRLPTGRRSPHPAPELREGDRVGEQYEARDRRRAAMFREPE